MGCRLMIRMIDSILNSITMYRVVLYGLIFLAVVTFVLGASGHLFYTPLQQSISLLTLLVTCFAANWLCAKAIKAPTNVESFAITALILFFLIDPGQKMTDVYVYVMAAAIAMTSKYVFAWRGKHLFNPAAIAAFMLGMLGYGSVSWWIASDVTLPFVLVVGLFIVRKIRRFTLFFSFVGAALLSIAASSLKNGLPVLPTLLESFVAWPILFLGTVMLTEPLTTPPVKKLQIAYGAIIGLLFGVHFNIGPVFSTPELAILVGNIFSFIVSPKMKLLLTLEKRQQIAEDTYEFLFHPNRSYAFAAGQYMEWTIPHHRPDSRGNRRYFTIASSPTEKSLRLVVRIGKTRSSFKEKLLSMKPKEVIVASQLSGDFTLPKEKDQKLVFIAGGIGFTPFISMIKYLLDQKERRDITLFYVNKVEADIAFKELFVQAEQEIGLKTKYVLTKTDAIPQHWTGLVGRMSEKMIQKEVPDFKERRFYLSGPNAMVDAYKHLLAKLGVPKQNIVTDYFPGF